MSGPGSQHSLGVVLLAHSRLDRVAQLARHWALGGCPVVIHVDARTPQDQVDGLRRALSDLADVGFARRQACPWGSWGLVAATQEASAQLLADHPQVDHVMLCSGSCLPVRPVEALRAHLARHPGVDFIESHRAGAGQWAAGGLEMERFIQRFPISWKRNRALFDRWVKFQRRHHITRRVPPELTPHLGRQWWCLSRATLQAILDDPRRVEWERYFRGVWIPDEAYFQTLVRRHSREVSGQGLTLSVFDATGQPYVFYDDHLPLLRGLDAFVVRKVWSGADQLYKAFLGGASHEARDAAGFAGSPRQSSAALVQRLEAQAHQARIGQPGRVMQSRAPAPWYKLDATPGRYRVFYGFDALFPEFAEWLAASPAAEGPVHGALFGPDRAEFADGAHLLPGVLDDRPAPRNADPMAFLRNLLHHGPAACHSFQFHPRDWIGHVWAMGQDPNARFSVISGAWVLPLWNSGAAPEALVPLAARLLRREGLILNELRASDRRAQLQLWSLGEALADPRAVLEGAFAPLPQGPLPKAQDTAGLEVFLDRLASLGVAIHSARSRPVLPGVKP